MYAKHKGKRAEKLLRKRYFLIAFKRVFLLVSGTILVKTVSVLRTSRNNSNFHFLQTDSVLWTFFDCNKVQRTESACPETSGFVLTKLVPLTNRFSTKNWIDNILFLLRKRFDRIYRPEILAVNSIKKHFTSQNIKKYTERFFIIKRIILTSWRTKKED
jgi:hypothetical protein